ncbi:MAG TPA: flagellar biosynthetic protein FliR [Kofleriaceae bacterium]|nr:flagellar biosynthetic protein FliR [Kofleriaceae bacterium]
MTLDQAAIAGYLAAFGRAAAFLHAAPLTGDRQLSTKGRAAVAAVLALAVSPARPPIDPSMLPLALPAEILLGLLAGFTARMVLAGAEAGGELIGLQFGLGFANSVDPSRGEPSATTRQLALCIAGLAFLAAGGLEAGVRVLAAAPCDVYSLHAGLDGVIRQSGEVLVAGLRVAAPALIAGTLTNLGLALASRAAPALNVFSVMLAGMLIVGAIVLLATAPVFTRQMQEIGQRAHDSLTRFIEP